MQLLPAAHVPATLSCKATIIYGANTFTSSQLSPEWGHLFSSFSFSHGLLEVCVQPLSTPLSLLLHVFTRCNLLSLLLKDMPSWAVNCASLLLPHI
jgi:hypothetical protein